MAGFCTSCGNSVNDNATYCRKCGNRIVPVTQARAQMPQQPLQQPPYPQPAHSPQQSPYPQPVQPPYPGYSAAAMQARPVQAKKKKKHRFLRFLLTVAIIAGLVYTGLYQPGWVHDAVRLTKPMPEVYQQGSRVAKVIDNSEVCTIGTMAENGYSVEIQPGTFPDGTEITVEYVPIAEKKEKDFQAFGSPIRIRASGYEGGYLGEGVAVTMEIPERMRTDKYSRYFMAYYNEEKQDYEYYPFDQMDWENNTLTYTLPHFSEFTPALASRDKAVDVYLDAYCMQAAMNQEGVKRLKEALGPELERSLKELGIPKEETADFVNSVAGAIIDQNLQGTRGEAAGHTANLITAGYKYKQNGDVDAFNESLTQTVCEVTAQKLLQAKYGDAISSNPAKIISGVVAKSGSIAGSLETGDYRQVASDIGSIIISLNPTAAAVSAAADLAVASANAIKQNFKATEVEKLYQMYKNGSREFQAGNFEELWYSVDYSFWYGSSRASYVLLKDDYVKEYCYNRGWTEDTLKTLPADKLNEINSFTKERLKAYFEERARCEEAAEKLKKKERRFIEDLGSTLDFPGYDSFLGKDPMTRLSTIYHMREFLTSLIDEKKQDKADYAELILAWIGDEADGKSFDEIKQHMVRLLKEKGLLKAGIEVQNESLPTLSEVCGTYTNVKGSLKAESSWLKQFSDYMNETFGEGTVTGLFSGSDTAAVEDISYTFTFYREGEGIRLKMVMNDFPDEAYIYSCTYNEGKGTMKAKLVSEPGDAIQLGTGNLNFEFTKRGNMIYFHSEQNMNTVIGKFHIKFDGQRSLE